MFTGIVEDTGVVQATEDDADGRRLRIGTDWTDLVHGDSVSVSGVCLTVEDQEPGEWFAVFLAEETVERSYLGGVATGDSLNLERAMPVDGRFDGHVVQGHVDGVGEVLDVESVGEDWRFTFSLPAELSQYVVEKGSLTVDGISLTVADRDSESVTVAIIPATYELTTLSAKDAGDSVHLEVDVIAKYVERMVQESTASDAS